MKEQLRKVFGDLGLLLSTNVSKPTNVGSFYEVVIEPKEEIAFDTIDEDADYSAHYDSHRPGDHDRTSHCLFHCNFRERSIFRGRVDVKRPTQSAHQRLQILQSEEILLIKVVPSPCV